MIISNFQKVINSSILKKHKNYRHFEPSREIPLLCQTFFVSLHSLKNNKLMDRNTITGLVLIFAVIVGYSWWASPSAEEREQMQREQMEQRIEAAMRQDSLARLTMETGENDISVQTDNYPSQQTTNEKPVPQKDEQNLFSNSQIGEKQITTFETDVFIIEFSNLGGAIENVILKDYLVWTRDANITLFNQDWHNFYISFFVNNRLINSKDYYFEVVSNSPNDTKITGNETAEIAMRLYANDGETLDKSRYIEFVYGFTGSEYMIDFQMNFVGMNDLISNRRDYIDLHWNAVLPRNEKAPNLEDPNTAIYFKPNNAKVDRLRDTRDDRQEINTPVRWIAFKHQFFSSVLIMKDDPIMNADLANFTDPNRDKSNYVKTMNALIGLPYRAEPNYSINMELYLGPNKYSTLTSYNMDLERLIPLGWGFFLMHWVNRFAVIPTFDFLQKFNMSYGMIILILTILLKVVLSPLTLKSWISSAKMKVVKPEVDELSKKFPKPEQAMEKQKAVMALYKKAGINQLSGCIPMLLQFPILIAMFRFFPSSIELRQESFLWADDLSTYDSIVYLPFNIPFYGAHISLFAILMAVSNVFYTRVTMRQNASSMAMPGMKMMMYFMPVMLLMFLNSFSSALNYYYFVSTCMTFLITWVTSKLINEEKVHRMVAEARKKPVVKSNWTQRLEDMAKKQQEAQRRKK
jgi:YidC/Oxa1 family membrane protein insertase